MESFQPGILVVAHGEVGSAPSSSGTAQRDAVFPMEVSARDILTDR